MPINPIVPNPESIRSKIKLEVVIDKISLYEREMGEEAGVLLIQNTSFGSIYYIRTKSEAEEDIRSPRTCEWDIKFYPRKYFEELRRVLESGKKLDYSKLERYVLYRQQVAA